jgi:hypothetical protein
MSKFFRVGNRVDTLAYYVLAPNRETAIKVVEDLTGPMNPSRAVVTELSECPEGYTAAGEEPQILMESEE